MFTSLPPGAVARGYFPLTRKFVPPVPRFPLNTVWAPQSTQSLLPNGAPLPPSLGAAQSSSTALVTTNYFRKLRSRPWLGAAAPAPVPAPPAPRPALAALAASAAPAPPVAAAAPRPAAPRRAQPA